MIRSVHSITIKTKGQVAAIFGAKLAAEILARGAREGSQKKPRSVAFYAEKPAYHLNDGDTLTFYALDLAAQRIIAEVYGGSADTTFWHQSAQLAEGGKAPGDAVIAICHYWNGHNQSWTVDVISDHITKMLPPKEEK